MDFSECELQFSFLKAFPGLGNLRLFRTLWVRYFHHKSLTYGYLPLGGHLNINFFRILGGAFIFQYPDDLIQHILIVTNSWSKNPTPFLVFWTIFNNYIDIKPQILGVMTETTYLKICPQGKPYWKLEFRVEHISCYA